VPRVPRPELFGVVLLALLAVLSPLERDLFVGDETKYAQVVREMRQGDGSLLVPTLNGEPYTHKPPLHFWLVYMLTGLAGERSLWPYVLPALLSGAVAVWLTGRIAAGWIGAAAIWPSRFFLAGLALVWGLSQTARMDLMFACLTTAGSVHLFRRIDGGGPRDGIAAGTWFGLAGLVKGPMAALILVSVFVVESVALRRRTRVADLAPFLVAAAIPLAWFVPAVLSAGSPYLEEILARQTAGRVVDSWVHREPPWYYFVAAPAIVFPFFFLLVSAIRSVRVETEAVAPLRRCVRWIVAIVVPFSLMSSKLPVYMVPALPPVALLAGWYAGLVPERQGWRPLAAWGNRATLALLATASAAVLSGFVPVTDEQRALLEVSGIRVALGTMALVGLAGLVVGWRSVRAGAFVLPFVFALPLCVALTAAAPAINDVASSRLLVDEIDRHHEPGDRVGMYYTPHLWSRAMPVELEHAKQLTLGALEAGERPELLAVRSDRVERLGGLLTGYTQVSTVRFMGKAFNVYRRR
jgi:4-amino-4-deoxy-L-arabinose transferase-like glycosyltransferase